MIKFGITGGLGAIGVPIPWTSAHDMLDMPDFESVSLFQSWIRRSSSPRTPLLPQIESMPTICKTVSALLMVAGKEIEKAQIEILSH